MADDIRTEGNDFMQFSKATLDNLEVTDDQARLYLSARDVSWRDPQSPIAGPDGYVRVPLLSIEVDVQVNEELVARLVELGTARTEFLVTVDRTDKKAWLSVFDGPELEFRIP